MYAEWRGHMGNGTGQVSYYEALKREIYEEVLNYTCQNDDSQALQLLLSAVTSDTLMSLLSTLTLASSKLSCIQKAAGCGNNTFISIILQHLASEGVLPLLLLRPLSDGSKTALHLACDRARRKVVETIIDLAPQSAQYELIQARDENGNTVLHSAVASGDKRLVQALKLDQLTGEQRYAIKVKENESRLTAIDLAKQQNSSQIEGYLDDLLQESRIRKCNQKGGGTI